MNERAAPRRWADAEQLWTHTLTFNDDAWGAHDTPGMFLDKDAENPELITDDGTALRRSGRTREAIVQYRRALAIAPSFKKARENLELALGDDSQPGSAAAATPTGESAPPVAD